MFLSRLNTRITPVKNVWSEINIVCKSIYEKKQSNYSCVVIGWVHTLLWLWGLEHMVKAEFPTHKLNLGGPQSGQSTLSLPPQPTNIHTCLSVRFKRDFVIEPGCRDVIRYQVSYNSFDGLHYERQASFICGSPAFVGCVFVQLYKIYSWRRKSTEQTHTGTGKQKAKPSQCVRIKVEM